MRCLKIKEGKVVDVYIYDDCPEGLIEAPQYVGIGWGYEGGEFIRPTVTVNEPSEAQGLKKRKLTGVEFEGVMCSATAEDMWGLNAIRDWILAGNTTSFKFSNGSKLKLTSENVEAFETVWIPFRLSFFED